MRTVFCQKLQQEADGLLAPPMPGDKGRWIFENISQQAWRQWLEHQTRLINEKHLNLSDKSTRSYLTEQMERFFAGQAHDVAEGFVETPETNRISPNK